MTKIKVVTLCNILGVVGIFSSTNLSVANQTTLTQKQRLYNSKVSLTNNQLKTEGNDQNNILQQFKNYIDTNLPSHDGKPGLIEKYNQNKKLSLTQHVSYIKRYHGTPAHVGCANMPISFGIESSDYNLLTSFNYNNLHVYQDRQLADDYVKHYGNIGTNPTGYRLYNSTEGKKEAFNNMLEHMTQKYNYDWSNLLSPNSSNVNLDKNLFSFVIRPIMNEIEFNVNLNGVSQEITLNRGAKPSYPDPKYVAENAVINATTADSKFPIVLPELNSVEKWESGSGSHKLKENHGFFEIAGTEYQINGYTFTKSSSDWDAKDIQYTTYTTTLHGTGEVSVKTKVFKPYFDYYTETKDGGLVYYYGTDYTTTLMQGKDDTNSMKMLHIDPATIFQLDKVGYENGEYYTQSGLNEQLINAVMSLYYNDDLMSSYDKNGNKTDTPLWVRDFNGYEPYEDNALYFENSRYYKPIAGLADIESGGTAKWAEWSPYHSSETPVGPGLYDRVVDKEGIEHITTQQNYKDFFNALDKAFTENYSTKDESRSTCGLLTYDNYFKLRKWVKNFTDTNHYLPPLSDTKNFLTKVLAKDTGECRNTGWVQYLQNLNSGIDINNTDTLDDLALIIPSLNFDEWETLFQGTNLATDTTSWDNRPQDINQDLNAEDHKGKTYEHILNGQFVKNKIPVSSLASSNPNIDLIFNSGANLEQTNSKLYKLNEDSWGTPNDGKWEVEPNGNNVSNGTYTYRQGSKNIGDLSIRTAGKINVKNMTFSHTNGSEFHDVTTFGVEIPKELQILDKVDGGDYGLDKKSQVMIKPYALAPEFYDEETANPNFDASLYETDQYNPDNQPYALKPAGTIFNQIKNSSSMSDYDVLKEMFIDHKNDNCKALPFALVDLMNNDSFTYDLKPSSTQPTDFSSQITCTIDDVQGQMILSAGEGCSYVVSGFENASDPFVPPGGITPSKTGIIVGSTLGGLAVVGTTAWIILNRRRTTRSLNPEVKARRKAGDIED